MVAEPIERLPRDTDDFRTIVVEYLVGRDGWVRVSRLARGLPTGIHEFVYRSCRGKGGITTFTNPSQLSLVLALRRVCTKLESDPKHEQTGTDEKELASHHVSFGTPGRTRCVAMKPKKTGENTLARKMIQVKRVGSIGFLREVIHIEVGQGGVLAAITQIVQNVLRHQTPADRLLFLLQLKASYGGPGWHRNEGSSP